MRESILLCRRAGALLLSAACLLSVLGLAAGPGDAQTAPAATSTADGPQPAPGPAVAPVARPAQALRAPLATLPQDLSPWGMFMSADLIVKAVMVGLAFASVVTWTVWLAKSLELLAGKRRLSAALQALGGVRSLREAALRIGPSGGEAALLVRGALSEADLSQGLPREGIKERIAARFERIEAAAGRRMTRGTGVLATIGATAPFVGLFGTVWGIMNAFVGISRAQTTNLAVVAPGIAEALLATAIGLVAAIPAVMIYNVFARAISGYRAALADVSAAAMLLVGRELDGEQRLREAAE